MADYTVLIRRRAQRELEDLPLDVYPRIVEAIRLLAVDPRPRGCSKLRGQPAWRIRIGSYRVIYEIDDSQKEVTVRHVGHRRDVYR